MEHKGNKNKHIMNEKRSKEKRVEGRSKRRKASKQANKQGKMKQDRQCTHNVSDRSVHATIGAVEKQ
jgi:hypothetical protein